MTLTFAPSSTTTTALSVVCSQQEWALRRFWFGNFRTLLVLRKGLVHLGALDPFGKLDGPA